jgi:carbohydrate kinase (thermoresistant glucokinase family)
MIYIVMGVSGCGKSTVGVELANALNYPFFDADDYHTAANLAKMTKGIPLNDSDRQPWLEGLAKNILQWQVSGGAVLACSALKQSYRDILVSLDKKSVKYIYLKGDKELLVTRLNNRTNHFMPIELLTSQLESLEPPTDAITVLLNQSVEQIVLEIFQSIEP